MDLAVVRRLYAYTAWANGKLFAAAAELADDELRRPLVSSFPSLLATLAHMAGAEWLWLRRWQGESPAAPPEWWREPDLATVRARLDEVETARAAFLDRLGEGDLTRVVRYRLLSGEQRQGPLLDLLLHVVNHATYHRGQLVTLLRQLGRTPPSTDLLFFTDP